MTQNKRRRQKSIGGVVTCEYRSVKPNNLPTYCAVRRVQERVAGRWTANAVWDYVTSGGEMATGNTTMAEQDIIEEIGMAGLTYADDELLHTTEKIEDRGRWEFDPASSELENRRRPQLN